jgi:hypothetical protein
MGITFVRDKSHNYFWPFFPHLTRNLHQTHYFITKQPQSKAVTAKSHLAMARISICRRPACSIIR